MLCSGQGAAHTQHGDLSAWQAATPGSPHELRWTHEASGQVGENLHWLLEPQLTLGQHPDQGMRWRRAFIAARSGSWEVRAGRQIFDWSQTDTISPADAINPRDWSDITRVRKLAVPALSARYGGQVSVEAVFVPQQQSSHLPAREWLPRDVSAALAQRQATPDEAQYAVRMSGNWRQADWGLVWYRGHNSSPLLRLAEGARLQPYYARQRMLAFTGARQVGEANVLRLELARREGAYRYVASLDQEWSDALADGDTLYGIVQYAGSTRRHAAPWPDFNRVLEHSVMFKLNYDPQSAGRTVVEASGVFNTRERDSLWQVSLRQRVGAAVTVTVAGVVMRGSAGSFWGRQRGNQRGTVQVEFRY